ncbi:MAG: NAD(P)/FAD-dependent oxidoreductase [Deltaproteobacteria bacterium]|nr:NAD(P)/FAD-dependent oxidoreductase [Deltaproteobacteria bacterium]
MTPKVDSAFIRRAVEASDLAALRAALYQASGDSELEALGPVAKLGPEERARLIARAAHLLETELPGYAMRVPSDVELRKLMDLVLGVPTRDEHFEVRKGMLGFEKFPFSFRPGGARPKVPEGFEVAIIGAGLAGIAMAVQLEKLGIPYVVYERRSELGGVWSVHKYPDIRVDTLSITYEYTFEDQYPWREYFARGEDVRGYLEFVARKYGVAPHIRYEHDLEHARFDEERSVWNLTLRRGDGSRLERTVPVVISAAGLFSTPKLPDIPGVESFRGTIVHPTQWTSEHDVRGKRVAVVGNGSTGVQLLGPVAEQAEHVTVFQRTPQWISPRANYGRVVEPEVRWLLENVPGYWNWARYTSAIGLFTWHEDFLVPDPEWERQGGHITKKSDDLREILIGYIRQQVGDRPDLIAKLVPDYAPMLRRPVVDNGWYAALTRDDVELVTDPIARLTPTGIETVDGKHRELDFVVFATGFDVIKYLWPADYQGQGGRSLRAFWGDDARAYLGMLVPHFPNLFMLYGPNSQPVSGGISLPSWYQIWAAYVAQCLVRMFEGGHVSMAVRESAFRTYNERLDAEAAAMAFGKDTGSAARNYYLNSSGRLQVNTPFETADLYAMQKAPDFGDFVLS